MTKLLILIASVLVGLTGNEIVLTSDEHHQKPVVTPVSYSGGDVSTGDWR